MDDTEYTIEDFEEVMDTGRSPTRCPEGCIVEPDGVCPHGFESILLEAGLI